MNISFLTRSNCGTWAARCWLLFACLMISLVVDASASAQSSNETNVEPPLASAFHPSVLVFGGITQADFQPLIDLIQNTVHNESWLGTGQGLGTIQPFPSGVLVDTSGLLKKIELLPDSKSLHLRANTTPFRLSHDPRIPANLRKVSLTRLQRAAESRAAEGLPPDLAMQNLAGLTNIQYLIAIPESREIIIAGGAGHGNTMNWGSPSASSTEAPFCSWTISWSRFETPSINTENLAVRSRRVNRIWPPRKTFWQPAN